MFIHTIVCKLNEHAISSLECMIYASNHSFFSSTTITMNYDNDATLVDILVCLWNEDTSDGRSKRVPLDDIDRDVVVRYRASKA